MAGIVLNSSTHSENTVLKNLMRTIYKLDHIQHCAKPVSDNRIQLSIYSYIYIYIYICRQNNVQNDNAKFNLGLKYIIYMGFIRVKNLGD